MRPGNDQYPGNNEQGGPGWQGTTGYAQPGYGSPYGGPPSGQFPAGPSPYGPPQGQPPYGPGGAPPYGGQGAAWPRRGRPGLIVLTSFLVQLIVIAAIGNQAVAERVQKFSFDHGSTARAIAQTPLVYRWRFAPDGRDNSSLYLAMLLGLLTLFVVAALLTLALVRGSVTFGRALFGVWLPVIVATLVAGMVRRALVENREFAPYGGKVIRVLYLGGGAEIIAGICLGLVAGLIAAIVAVATRRPAVVPATAAPMGAFDAEREPEMPPPYYGEDRAHSPERGDSSTMSFQKVQGSVGHSDDRPRDTAEQRTQALPLIGADESRPPSEGYSGEQRPQPNSGGQPPEDATVRLPRFDPSGRPGLASTPEEQQRRRDYPPPESPRRDTTDEATGAFPRPPDDENIGDPDTQ